MGTDGQQIDTDTAGTLTEYGNSARISSESMDIVLQLQLYSISYTLWNSLGFVTKWRKFKKEKEKIGPTTF